MRYSEARQILAEAALRELGLLNEAKESVASLAADHNAYFYDQESRGHSPGLAAHEAKIKRQHGQKVLDLIRKRSGGSTGEAAGDGNQKAWRAEHRAATNALRKMGHKINHCTPGMID
jgi:hypothetical protein